MNYPVVIPYERPKLGARTRGSLLACGLWIRAGFIGASAAAVGMIQLFAREWSALSALSIAGAGVALVVLSYGRAQAALSDAGKPTTASDATPVPARP